MSPHPSPTMPLTREELIKLKHQIEPNDYLIVESGSERILVLRSTREFPDIVNDLEVMINKLDIRDTSELSHALIIGSEEVVGVPLDAIQSLLNRRIEDDEKIAEDLGEKLIEPFTTLLFESEDDPLKTLRLGIRLSGKLEEFKSQQLPEVLFSKIKSLPRTSEVVYLIADDGYLRLSGTEFYKRLMDFLRENPEINKKLSSEFDYMTRGKLADHFVDKTSDADELASMKQENLNKFGPIQDEPADIGLKVPEKDVIPDIKPEVKKDEISEKEEKKPQIHKETDETKRDKTEIDLIKNISIPDGKTGELKIGAEPPFEIEPDTEQAPPEPIAQSQPEPEISEVKEPQVEPEPEPEPDYVAAPERDTTGENIEQFKNKLSKSGFIIVKNLDVPGVDLVAKNPESIVRRVFFTYMPRFSLRKALELERSVFRFSPELSVVIGDTTDPELRLFTVGKNILITDFDKILNTDLLTRLEEHI